MTAINRRRALTGTAAVAAGVPLLAACSGSDDSDTATDPSGSGEATTDSGSGGSGGASASALATTADVPVGGCFVVESAKVVLTQPTEGDFKAFSAICTHQGCAVQSSTDGDIPCPCHNSRFSLEDGSVLDGPATTGLEAVEITVDGDAITQA